MHFSITGLMQVTGAGAHDGSHTGAHVGAGAGHVPQVA